MMNNSAWKNKYARRIQAEEHTRIMDEEFNKEIKDCIKESRIYDTNEFTYYKAKKPYYNTEIKLIDTDSVSALFNLDEELHIENIDDAIAVLNFASYKNPGGMFIKGAIAQEEAICHESALYNILSDKRFEKEFYGPNHKKLNKGLYHSNMIYTYNVPFVDDVNNEFIISDVITCAAPNRKVAVEYQHLPDTEVENAMRHRIRSVLAAAHVNSIKYIVLGAFGCGVFRNDPYIVANIFKELLEADFKDAFKQVIFAIPNKKSSNYIAFDKVLSNKEK